MNHKEKIKSLDEILAIVKKAKAEGKKIVTTNGSFDLFHAGHIDLLEKAKDKGDVLIVGVNSDKSVKEYKKKPGRPIIPDKYRAELLAAIMYVDYVFIFDDLIPNLWLEKIRPDVHANSAEYGANCVETEVLDQYGGELFLVPKEDIPLSTSGIEAKIKAEK
ncbi:MAG: adenylyltransferase/cytidyltransferase family protein [Candidatus Moranbacteria bacterium]|nr:adenylyltransferase/cytidyltransferase family protein [Candidatus Moranbacteria bacterium]